MRINNRGDALQMSAVMPETHVYPLLFPYPSEKCNQVFAFSRQVVYLKVYSLTMPLSKPTTVLVLYIQHNQSFSKARGSSNMTHGFTNTRLSKPTYEGSSRASTCDWRQKNDWLVCRQVQIHLPVGFQAASASRPHAALDERWNKFVWKALMRERKRRRYFSSQ